MGDFRLFVRRDFGYELRVSVKFSVDSGAGILSMPQRGQPDAPPTQGSEETDVSADALRGGRFIHLLQNSGKRQSYALSRLTADKLARLSDSDWTELEATTEFGFRYAVLPANLPAATSAGPSIAIKAGPSVAARPASVASVGPQVKHAASARPVSGPPRELGGAPSGSFPAASVAPAPGGLDRAKRPNPVASLSGSNPVVPAAPRGGQTIVAPDAADLLEAQLDAPAEEPEAPPAPAAEPALAPVSAAPPAPAPSAASIANVDLPARPSALDAAMTKTALSKLKKDELVAKLQAEYENQVALHGHIGDLERKLASARARERDLLALLGTWQTRED